MAKFSKDQWIGLLLIIAAILIWIPLPSFIASLRELAPIIVVAIGLYQLIK